MELWHTFILRRCRNDPICYARQYARHNCKLAEPRFFDKGEYELEVANEYNDEGLDWSVKANLSKVRKMEANDGFIWNGNADTEGILWGGCVESLIEQSTSAKYLPKDADLENTILFIETAEDIPEH